MRSSGSTTGAPADAAGVDLIEGIPIPGYDRFEFRDPFGNRVEFIQASRDHA